MSLNKAKMASLKDKHDEEEKKIELKEKPVEDTKVGRVVKKRKKKL